MRRARKKGKAIKNGAVLGFGLLFASVMIYDRARWPHWSDLNNDGLNTREEILIRDGCDDGLCACPYSQKLIQNDGHLDHIVSLSEAYWHGGWKWPLWKREQFANDPENLLMADAGTNISKSNRAESDWMPPDRAFWAEYIEKRLDIRSKYGLTMSAKDCRAIIKYLEEGDSRLN